MKTCTTSRAILYLMNTTLTMELEEYTGVTDPDSFLARTLTQGFYEGLVGAFVMLEYIPGRTLDFYNFPSSPQEYVDIVLNNQPPETHEELCNRCGGGEPRLCDKGCIYDDDPDLIPAFS